MKRAPLHRTFPVLTAVPVGGQMLRGGTTNGTSPWKGKQELKRTAGPSGLRAVASNHSSRTPSVDMAAVTAAYNESL
jgi:hypothetical protein